MDISILKDVVAQGPWAALFVALLLYVIRESARRETKLMAFVQAQGESLAKLAGKMEQMCAELELIRKISIAGSRKMLRDWQGGVPHVYDDIHTRNSNAASREADPRDGNADFSDKLLSEIKRDLGG